MTGKKKDTIQDAEKDMIQKPTKAKSDFVKIASNRSAKKKKVDIIPSRAYDKKFLKRLTDIVAKYTEHPEKLKDIEAGTDESFIEKLNIDSVDFVEIIVDAEEEFGIKIEDEEIKSLQSFDDLYNLIYDKIQEHK